jgi:hypothetical protein
MQTEGFGMTMDWNPDFRTSFGISSDALDKLDEIAERENMNRSEKLRELVRQEIERKGDLHGPQPVLPDDEELADAYQLLHDRAYADHKDRPRVKLETAKNKLYTNNTPKYAVLDDIIKPLERLEYLSVDPGHNQVWIVVRRMVYSDGEDIVSETEAAV